MADTSHLTTVEHGAYLLLLMAMWRAGGSLPNDDIRLARITKLSLDKWRKVAPNVMEFMTVDGQAVTQKRLKLEFEIASSKTEKLAAAGRAGGRAKALKNINRKPSDARETPEAIGCHSPSESLANQIPETRDQITASSSFHSEEAVAAAADEKISKEEIERRCIQAAGFGEMSGIGKLAALVLSESDLETRVLPIIRDSARGLRASGRKPENWIYFVKAVSDPDRKALPPSASVSDPVGFYAAASSPQLEAWQEYRRRTEGRTFPTDPKGGWRFPTEFPPPPPDEMREVI